MIIHLPGHDQPYQGRHRKGAAIVPRRARPAEMGNYGIAFNDLLTAALCLPALDPTPLLPVISRAASMVAANRAARAQPS